jgi:uncharacterized protein (DUF1697 family)
VAIFVALLRGINVGKSRRVAMADLRTALEEAGYPGVVTHLQTGNVVLSSSERSAAKVERALEDSLRAGLDLDVAVMVRSAAQLAKLLEDNPLLGRGADTKPLAIGFLKAKPPAAAARKVADADFGRDEFELRGTELYLRYPDGLGRSKMSSAFFERTLDTPITVRNWSVVTKLVQLAREH